MFENIINVGKERVNRPCYSQKLPAHRQMCICYDESMAIVLIKQKIKEKNIKVNRMLPFLSISRSTVYTILNGSKSPTINELEEFAKVLNVPIESLYESEYSEKNRKRRS